VTSSTTSLVASKFAAPWKVDFITRVPRGSTRRRASLDSAWRPRSFHRYGKAAGGKLFIRLAQNLDSPASRQIQFPTMPANQRNLCSGMSQDLSHQQPRRPSPIMATAVPGGMVICSRISHAAATGSVKVAAGSETLVGNSVQIHDGEGDIFRKNSGAIYDAQNGSVRTVPAQAPGAPCTMSAGKIDFSHHAPAKPLRVVAFHHAPNEFVPGNSVETRISF